MKKLLFLVVMLVLTINSSARVIWNVKAGAGVSGCFSNSEGTGFAAKLGVGAEVPLSSNLSLMPTLEGVYDEGRFNTLWIQLPVDLGYRIWLGGLTNLVLKAGPNVAISVEQEVYSAGENIGVNFEISHLVFGIEAMIASEERSNVCFVIGYRF